jgi:TatD DNase family protein
MEFIDTHAHLYLKEFDEDRDLMIERSLLSGVKKIILPNIDWESLSAVENLSLRFPNVCYPTIGLHPCDAKLNYHEILHQMEIKLNTNKYYAIGETGTDAYWDTTYMDQQIESFTIQINWSKEHQLPIIIHSRETMDQNIELIQKHQDGNLKGVFHCFSGTTEQARKIIEAGFLLGIGGVLTHKKSELKNVLKEIGAGSLVLETDAPFLTPAPYRSKRNESSYIPLIAQALSESLELDLKEISSITTQNANKIFKFTED